MQDSGTNTSDECGLKPRHQISSLFSRGRYPLGGFSALFYTDIIGLDKIDRLDITESDTLRIAVANVAFEHPPIGGVEAHGTKRAYADT